VRYKTYLYYQGRSDRKYLYTDFDFVKSEDEVDGLHIADDVYINSKIHKGKVQPGSFRVYIPEDHTLFNIDIAYFTHGDEGRGINSQFIQFEKDMSLAITPFIDVIDKVIADRKHNKTK
jgi:hypothetical protein